MTAYVMHAVMMRDGESPIPAWMQRVTIWGGDARMSIRCDAPLDAATELLVEGLLRVLRQRGREAEPIMEDGEVRGMRW